MKDKDVKAGSGAQQHSSRSRRPSWPALQAPAVAYRPDADLSPEAVRTREFLRAVLSIDYGVPMNGATSYPHDEFFHYAAVLYDRYNWSRVSKRHSQGTLASRAMDLSASTTHLMLDRHVYHPARELGIQKDAIETILMRYLHFADPVARIYGIEALVAKVTTDRSIITTLHSDQSILQAFERAMMRVILEHFPAAHPLRREAEAVVQAMEKAVQEMSETHATTAAKSRRDVDAELPEYVRWLNWFSRSVYG